MQCLELLLIGSGLIETGRWISERLRERGIRAVHIVAEKNGRTTTLPPRKRTAAIASFRPWLTPGIGHSVEKWSSTLRCNR